jgi:hypothetical protein
LGERDRMSFREQDFDSSSSYASDSSDESSSCEDVAKTNYRNLSASSVPVVVSAIPPIQKPPKPEPTPQPTQKPAISREELKAALNTNRPLRPIGSPSVDKTMPTLLSSPVVTTVPTTTVDVEAAIQLKPMTPIKALPPIFRAITQEDREIYAKKQQTNNPIKIPSFTPLTVGGLLGTQLGCHHDKKKKTVPKVLSPFNSNYKCHENGDEEAKEDMEKQMLEGGPEDEEKMYSRPKAIALTSADKDFFGITENKPKCLDSSLKERMLISHNYFNSIKSEGMQSLLSTGKLMNLASANACSIEHMSYHIRDSHGDFYELLQANTLLPIVFAGEDSASIMIVIPPHQLLQQVVDVSGRVSEATRRILLYHVIKRGGGPLLQKVIGMLSYETLLEGKIVQVEEDRDVHRINGNALRSDPNCPYSIFFIRGLLDPDEVLPTIGDDGGGDDATDDAGDDTANDNGGGEDTTNDDGDNNGDQDSNPPTDSPDSPPEEMTKTNLPYNVTSFLPIDKNYAFTNDILSKVSNFMSQSYYNGSLDLHTHKATPKIPKSVSMVFMTFNTEKAFNHYRDHKLKEMTQIVPEKTRQFDFPSYAQHHFNYNNNLPFTEYECPSGKMDITKDELVGGNRLVGLSFNSPLDEKHHTIMLCQMKQSPTDTNVYMTKDENLLIRFRGTILDRISVNHKGIAASNAGIVEEEPLHENHFLEVGINSAMEEKLYKVLLTPEEFGHCMMTNGKISKYLKKRAHDAKKGAGKAIRKGNQLVKTTGAIEMKRADGNAMPDGLEDAISNTGNSITGSATILLFSNSFKSIAPKNGRSNFSYDKKTVVTEGGDQVVVMSMEDGNGVGVNIGENNPGKYITLQLSDAPKMTFRVARIRPKIVSDVFYGVVESKLYIFKFSRDGDLSYIYTILKNSDAAKRLLAAK